MNIAIVSDTHGDFNTLENIFKTYFSNADMIIHLGDGVREFFELIEQNKFSKIFHAVKGNCDFDPAHTLPKSKLFTLPNGLKIFACHGHTFDVKNSIQNLKDHCKTLNVSLALFGHTHVRLINIDNPNKIVMLNPGSPSFPRCFGPSIGLVSISDDQKINAKIVEL